MKGGNDERKEGRQRKMAANCRPRLLPLRFHPFFQDIWSKSLKSRILQKILSEKQMGQRFLSTPTYLPRKTSREAIVRDE